VERTFTGPTLTKTSVSLAFLRAGRPARHKTPSTVARVPLNGSLTSLSGLLPQDCSLTRDACDDRLRLQPYLRPLKGALALPAMKENRARVSSGGGDGVPKHGARPVNEEHAQVGVAALTDGAEVPPCARRVFAWREAQIAGEVPRRRKARDVADGGDESGRGEQADTRSAPWPPRSSHCASPHAP
jgi:hypothetical protein